MKRATRHGGNGARRTAVFTAGNAGYLAGQFTLMWLLARLGDPVLVGAYGLTTAVLNPIFFFSKMGMRQAQSADVSEAFSFFAYRRLRHLLLLCAVTASLICSLFLPSTEGVLFVFATVLMAKIVEENSDLYYGLLLQNRWQHIIGVSMLAKSASAVGGYLAIYFLSADPMISLVGMPLGWGAVHLAYTRPRSEALLLPGRNSAEPSWQVVRSLALHLWPLALGGALIQFQQSFPRLLVSGAMGVEVLGAIVPVLQVHLLATTLGNSIVQSLLPGLASDIQRGSHDAARRQVLCTAGAFLPLLLVGIVASAAWGEPLMIWAFGDEYRLSGIYMGLASVSWSLRLIAAPFQNAVVGAQRFDVLLRTQVIVSIVSALSGLVLWLYMGLPGVFIGLIAGNSAHFALCYRASWPILRPGKTVNA